MDITGSMVSKIIAKRKSLTRCFNRHLQYFLTILLLQKKLTFIVKSSKRSLEVLKVQRVFVKVFISGFHFGLKVRIQVVELRNSMWQLIRRPPTESNKLLSMHSKVDVGNITLQVDLLRSIVCQLSLSSRNKKVGCIQLIQLCLSTFLVKYL